MSPEADRILQVFRTAGLRSGGFVHSTDFGEAMVWEAGFMRDESVRNAISYLLDHNYLVELDAGFQLTDEGEKYLYPEDEASGAGERCPATSSLLAADARTKFRDAYTTYPYLYDQVFEEVHARLNAAGFATKLDLAALITWKHVNNAPWMAEFLQLPPLAIQQRTQAAFAANLTDEERIAALGGIPGFGSGGAFTSVLLAAWRPTEFGVYDGNATGAGWDQVIDPACTCQRTDLVIYFRHLRQMAEELGSGWTPRDVDMALFQLGRRS